MNIKEQSDKEIYWVLKEIKNLIPITLERNYVEYDVMERRGDGLPSSNNQRRILRKIEELGAVRIKRETYGRGHLLDSPAPGILGAQPIIFYLEIVQPKFAELFKYYEKLAMPLPDTVEFHYSQNIVSINYAGQRYAPRDENDRKLSALGGRGPL